MTTATTTHRYHITSSEGADYGVWEGESSAHALLALHRDAGATAREVWIEDGTLRFAPAPSVGDGTGTYEALYGDVDAWHIVEIPHLAVGDRVEAGEGEDHDTGTITAIDGDVATVAWDSLVRTPADLSALQPLREEE